MSMVDLDVEQARRFFGLRFFGALAAVSAAAPLMRPGGSITLAVELAPVRVNAVSPGVLRSPSGRG
jgi:NAD(P)-dependent dehydrogenase (short-subunit alcohol dehydrogenase family)